MPPFPTCWQSVFRNFLTTVPCLPVRDYIKQVETIKAQEELARKAALPGMANKMKDANLRLMHRHTTDKGLRSVYGSAMPNCDALCRRVNRVSNRPCYARTVNENGARSLRRVHKNLSDCVRGAARCNANLDVLTERQKKAHESLD